MLFSSTFFTRAEIVAVVAAVLIAGTSKYVGVYSLRQYRWKRALICAGVFFGMVFLLINVMNGDLDLAGNRVWIFREQNGQIVRESRQLLGSSTYELAAGKTIELHALPAKYQEGGVTYHRSTPANQAINDTNRAITVKMTYSYREPRTAIVEPGAVYVDKESSGGEMVWVQDDAKPANNGESPAPHFTEK